MNKDGVVKHMGAEMGVTEAQATRMVDAFINAVRSGLDRDARVHIRGLGVFTQAVKAERLIPSRVPGKPGRWSKPSQTTRFVPSTHFMRVSGGKETHRKKKYAAP